MPDYDVTDVGAEILPPGLYFAEIADASVKQTKQGLNFINVTWTVFEGDFGGMQFDDPFYINSTSAKGKAMFKERLRSMVDQCGLPPAGDCAGLIGGRCAIEVSVERSERDADGKPFYRDKNRVERYTTLNEYEKSQAPKPASKPEPKPAPVAASKPAPARAPARKPAPAPEEELPTDDDLPEANADGLPTF
jgi:hypothetical protein